MELVVAHVQRSVDRLERLEVNVELLLLSILCDDGSTVDEKTVRRTEAVQLQSLLSRSDGRQHRESVRETGGCQDRSQQGSPLPPPTCSLDF